MPALHLERWDRPLHFRNRLAWARWMIPNRSQAFPVAARRRGVHLKPEVVAPGVAILSSVPGGGYRQSERHVDGRAASRRYRRADAIGCAGPDHHADALCLDHHDGATIAATYPNNDYGWGRVDAFNAVVSVLHTGSISGVVRRSDTGCADSVCVSPRGFPPRHVEQCDRR